MVRLLADRRVEGFSVPLRRLFSGVRVDFSMKYSTIRTSHIARWSAALIAAAVTALAACATPTPMTPSDAPPVSALIVKPRIATSDPAAVLKPMSAALGQSAGVRYVRPMAGDAHIVYLTAPAQRSEVPQLVERLRASGAFQYIEVDSMMKVQ